MWKTEQISIRNSIVEQNSESQKHPWQIGCSKIKEPKKSHRHERIPSRPHIDNHERKGRSQKIDFEDWPQNLSIESINTSMVTIPYRKK